MRQMLSLNEGWAFQYTNVLPVVLPLDWPQVDLPHTWNADLTQGAAPYRRGQGVYAKTLSLRTEAGQIAFLEIRGCNTSADVYLDGVQLAHHDGGYSTFRIQLPALDRDALLCVLADNGPSDRVYPQMADFTFYGGLYREVNLILVPETHFELIQNGTPGIKVRAVPDDAEGYAVTVETWQNGGKVIITVDGQTQTVLSENGHAKADFVLTAPRLWDGLNDPYLYEARAALIGENGNVLDEISTSFGCRSYRIDPKEGFFLNGRSYPLRGVSRHQDRSPLGNALTRREHDEDMALIRELGANSIRLAHYQHDSYFYELCDRFGMVVWAEIPYISAHMPAARENTFSQMRELIVQNFNHPSIVVWGLSNEITMQGLSEDLRDNHRGLQALVRRLDPDRLTVMANVMMLDIHDPLIHLPDAIAYNIYFGWYVGKLEDNDFFFDTFHREVPDVPVGFSEYGCDTNPSYHSPEPKRGDYSEEYQLVYHEHILKLIEARPWLWCTYAWNMFDFGAANRDEGGTKGVNQKGLVTMDRRIKKDAFYLYKAHWSKDPFVHLCGRRYENRHEAVTNVIVYSNQPEVTLYVDGQRFEKQRGKTKFVFRIPIQKEHRLEAISGGWRDEITIRRVPAPDERYVLKGGGILNWFDAEGLKADAYSLKDQVRCLMESPEASAVVIGCVNRPGKDESEFILNLRAHPEELKDLDLTMEQVLERANPFISANIKRHVNAALQQIRREE